MKTWWVCWRSRTGRGRAANLGRQGATAAGNGRTTTATRTSSGCDLTASVLRRAIHPNSSLSECLQGGSDETNDSSPLEWLFVFSVCAAPFSRPIWTQTAGVDFNLLRGLLFKLFFRPLVPASCFSNIISPGSATFKPLLSTLLSEKFKNLMKVVLFI